MTLFGDIMNICIIGKSKRFEVLKSNLKNRGFKIQSIESADELPDNINAHFIVLPIPTSLKDGRINLEGAKPDLTADKVLDRARNQTVVIACNYTDDRIRTIDLNTREDFAFLNAIPTAEGAINAAVTSCSYSLFYGKILITGFGRVAKILADRLKGLKCNITIAARSLKDLSYAKALGFDTVSIKELENEIDRFDLIFQTVPCLILTSAVLDRTKPDAVIIELSSKSAGTDYAYAEEVGKKVIHAQALPEKVAPLTAGNILTESVLSIIAENNTID